MMIESSQGLVNFCHWLQNTPYALAISGSSWAYPFVQMTHFTGISLWLGTNLALDFRLLDWMCKDQQPSKLAKSLFSWNWIGFAIVVIGGVSLFLTDAIDFALDPAFQVKLAILIPIALIVHIIVQQKTIRSWADGKIIPRAAKIAGLAEFLLWVCVVSAAANIPYFEKF